jgi:hypothetical protein
MYLTHPHAVDSLRRQNAQFLHVEPKEKLKQTKGDSITRLTPISSHAHFKLRFLFFLNRHCFSPPGHKHFLLVSSAHTYPWLFPNVV